MYHVCVIENVIAFSVFNIQLSRYNERVSNNLYIISMLRNMF